MEWVPEIDYRDYSLTLLALEIEETQEKTGKVKKLTFQWLTGLAVNLKNAREFANAGRGRWRIENQGFNIQKNIRYGIQHADSLNYNAMKCHYLLTQIADMLLQLYEKGRPGIRAQKNNKKYILRPAGKFWPTAHRGRYVIYNGLWICKSRLTEAIIAEGSGFWQDVNFSFPQKIKICFLLL